MRFKKVLVAVDFSGPSRTALQSAAEMAVDSGAELVLVHVWEPTAQLYGMPAFPVAFADDYIAEAKQGVESAKQDAERTGAKRVSTLVLTGTPWHEIVELLRKDHGYDLVVVGTHGRTGLKHVLLGSVAERIVRHSPVPVLVIRTRD
jgi:nucleotide-binding universal stress UspA family protein